MQRARNTGDDVCIPMDTGKIVRCSKLLDEMGKLIPLKHCTIRTAQDIERQGRRHFASPEPHRTASCPDVQLKGL